MPKKPLFRWAWACRHTPRYTPREWALLLGAGTAAAYPYLTPVLAAAFAWLFLGEPITAVVVVCGVVIAAGVYLLNRA